MSSIVAPNTPPETSALPLRPCLYIGCSTQDLLELQIEAWDEGYRRASCDTVSGSRDFARIAQLATQACDDALRFYVPLDETVFRSTYVHAWSAGYYAAMRGDTWVRAYAIPTPHPVSQ